ncbi:MAG: hypothetical protein QOG83_2626 [Alphaproteobacteria bacterium]|nr:hypothetical protein [Alphaproteobacteria bacterium]
MQDLRQALADISAIRGQMARGTVFRGYGPATLAATGLLALLAAVVQSYWIDDPARDIRVYLALWVATAALAVLIVASEAVRRSRRIHDGLADDMLRAAAEQFTPAAIAGVLLTLVLVRTAEAELWMLPGLWQILFSLGVFASCRSLPRAMVAVAIWYLATGLACLALADGAHALSPWAMGVPFFVGQMLAALLLKRSFGGGDGEA